MDCRVSVIVPVYNCKSYLSRAIDSVVNQEDFYLDELILIDDGSTDGSSEVCDLYSSEYPNVCVIHQSNKGVSAARNAGLEIARGEWIFFLDSDDYILDNAFNELLYYCDADLISGNYSSNIPHENLNLEKGIHEMEIIKEKLCLKMIYNKSFYNCWGRLYKRSIIVDNKILFPLGVKVAEDMVFVYSYIKNCHNLAFTDSDVYYYNVNYDNTTSVIPEEFSVIHYIYKWQSEYFECMNYQDYLDDIFTYRAFMSIKTSANYLNFSSGIKYLSSILNNDDFIRCYLKEDYKKFSCKTDHILDKSIREKKPGLIYLAVQFCKFKSMILKWF